MKNTGAHMIDTPINTVFRDSTTKLQYKHFEPSSPLQRLSTLFVFAALFVAFCGIAPAQDVWDYEQEEPIFELRPEDAHGYGASGMNLSEYEDVNLGNGNLIFNVPLASISTDGGLSYSVSAYYNSKIRGLISEIGPVYYRGIENYGIGWDMRPPRLSATIGCKLGNAYPECENSKYEYTVSSYVTPSGASQRLISVPPPHWSKDDQWPGIMPDNDDYPDDDGFGEDCIGEDFDPDNPFHDCACKIDLEHDNNWDYGSLGPQEKTQICYTWNEPLTRVILTATNSEESEPRVVAIAEDESGLISRFDHMVDTRGRLASPEPQAQDVFFFREELDGFYLKSLERGPWESGLAKNVINFEYDDVEPWLVSSITASGEIPRSLTFTYTPSTYETRQATTLKTLTVPAFAGDTTAITFTYATANAQPHLPNDPNSWDAPFLTSITAQPGSPSSLTWVFSTKAVANAAQILEFRPPTGATIDYSYQGFPSWRICSLNPPREQVANFPSGALYTRTLRTLDATDNERVETTAFWRNINCLTQETHLERLPYPASPFFQERFDSLGGGLYYWLWVETYAGDADPLLMQTSSTAEIHRFFGHSFREFSVDYFSTIPLSARVDFASTIYKNAPLGNNTGRWETVPESFLLGFLNLEGVDLLRHRRTQRATLFEIEDDPGTPDYNEFLDEIPCCPYPWSFFNNTVDWSNTITNENDSGENNPSSDIRNCTALAADGTVNCQEVTTDYDVNLVFQPQSENVQVTNAPTGLNASRYTEYKYDEPYILTDRSVWDFGKPIKTGTYDSQDGVLAEQIGSEWEVVIDADNPGFRRLKKQGNNPQFEDDFSWHCTDTAEDCFVTTFSYDALGNVNRVAKSGGIGDGFGEPIPDKVIEYSHGKPFRLWLESGNKQLLLWESHIDPSTGLTLWRVDGSGVGKAYLYDGLGRVTDVAPIEGDFDDDASTWNLKLQTYGFDANGQPININGSHFFYFYPIPANPSLAWRKALDASYSLSQDGVLYFPTVGDLRAQLFLDGMGRPTQLTEHYEGGSRSKYSLSYFHDQATSSPLNPCGVIPSLPYPARVGLTSEWIDGEWSNWSGCSALDWTVTEYDGLNRLRKQRLPDNSGLTTEYTGANTVKTTRKVVTEATGNEKEMVTTAVSDALGRLRFLKEPIFKGEDSNQDTFVESLYVYDAKDRLRSVSIGTGTPQRTFDYSNTGLLKVSIEPERSTQLLAYDALGNLRALTTDGVAKEIDFDSFGRAVTTTVSGQQATLLSYGDGIGQPEYNKVVSTLQHNRDDETGWDVSVTSSWEYDGPGARVNNKRLKITGLGDGYEEFLVSYGYDQWGNASDIRYPRFDDCRASLWDGVSYVYDGSWLTRMYLAKTYDTKNLAAFSYLPSGRIGTTEYSNGFAKREETAGSYNMARPKTIDLVFTDNERTVFPVGDYSYDGSGNIWKDGNKTYTYDGLNRLTSYMNTSSNPATEESYEYDIWGNIISLDRNSNIFDYDVSSNTNRINSITVDGTSAILDWGRGNLTHIDAFGNAHQREKTFKYSGEDRLMKSIDGPPDTGIVMRYAYDAFGERVLRWWPNAGDTEARFYLRDEAGRVLSEWRYTSDGFDVYRDHFFGATGQIAQISYDGTTDLTYIAADHLGSTRFNFGEESAIFEETDYYPFGNFLDIPGLDSDPRTDLLFTGHERDNGTATSELDYMHARYYSPTLARFVSVDPVGGSIGSSQAWNRYSYVLNNPLKLVDPDGESPIIGAGIGAFVGGLLEWGRQKSSGTSMNWQKVEAAALGGAMTGALAVATGGTSIAYEIAGGGVAAVTGGTLTRAIDGDVSTAVFDDAAMAKDLAGGVAGASGSAAVNKVLGGVLNAMDSPIGAQIGKEVGSTIANTSADNALKGAMDSVVDLVSESLIDNSAIANNPAVNCHRTPAVNTTQPMLVASH